jgi:hypothetical protein
VSSCEGTTFFPSAIGGKDDSKGLTFSVQIEKDDSIREKFGDRGFKIMGRSHFRRTNFNGRI